MNVKLEFVRESKFTYSPGRHTIRWTLCKKRSFRSLLIDCQEIHDETGVRFLFAQLTRSTINISTPSNNRSLRRKKKR